MNAIRSCCARSDRGKSRQVDKGVGYVVEARWCREGTDGDNCLDKVLTYLDAEFFLKVNLFFKHVALYHHHSLFEKGGYIHL